MENRGGMIDFTRITAIEKKKETIEPVMYAEFEVASKEYKEAVEIFNNSLGSEEVDASIGRMTETEKELNKILNKIEGAN